MISQFIFCRSRNLFLNLLRYITTLQSFTHKRTAIGSKIHFIFRMLQQFIETILELNRYCHSAAEMIKLLFSGNKNNYTPLRGFSFWANQGGKARVNGYSWWRVKPPHVKKIGNRNQDQMNKSLQDKDRTRPTLSVPWKACSETRYHYQFIYVDKT